MGLVALGVGTVFFVDYMNVRDTVARDCPNNVCDPLKQDANSAQSLRAQWNRDLALTLGMAGVAAAGITVAIVGLASKSAPPPAPNNGKAQSSLSKSKPASNNQANVSNLTVGTTGQGGQGGGGGHGGGSVTATGTGGSAGTTSASSGGSSGSNGGEVQWVYVESTDGADHVVGGIDFADNGFLLLSATESNAAEMFAYKHAVKLPSSYADGFSPYGTIRALDIAAGPAAESMLVGSFAGETTLPTNEDLYLKSEGGQDCLIALYDDSSLMLLDQIGGPGFSECRVVTHVLNDGYYVAGELTGDLTLPVAAASSGLSDIFVAKFSDNGVFQWLTAFGNLLNDRVAGIGVNTQGQVIVVGDTQNEDLFGGQDLFFAKLDGDDGNVIETWSVGTATAEKAREAWISPDGSISVAGVMNGGTNFGNGAIEGDAFVVHFGPDKKAKWSHGLKSVQGVRVEAVTMDDAGNTYIGGGFAGDMFFLGQTFNASFDLDAFAAKFDPDGHAEWVHMVTASANNEDEVVTAMTWAAPGRLFAAGTFVDEVNLGPDVADGYTGVASLFAIEMKP
ncbi:MAG: hypothetical protein IPK82_02125 [Polyangiaceae bacterium]|nr:hypothetical protein [Polyangiaceae bacterium]